MIRKATLEDSGAIADIYNYYIDNTIITFEDEPVSSDEIGKRIAKVLNEGYPYIVYLAEERIVGYAYLDKWRTRRAYDITLETSIYLAHGHDGHGIGSLLYVELIEQARAIGIHSLMGVVSHPNVGSDCLHRKFGFELVGTFREVGCKFGRLIDVEFWQLIL